MKACALTVEIAPAPTVGISGSYTQSVGSAAGPLGATQRHFAGLPLRVAAVLASSHFLAAAGA